MATVSSHILDSVSGKPAVAIRSQLFQLSDRFERRLLFDVAADHDGRVVETIEIDESNSGSEFELVFHGAEYFAGQSLLLSSVVDVVVIRFRMRDNRHRYHLPLMLSPHSYSTWWTDFPAL